jgi:hypothetical protein
MFDIHKILLFALTTAFLATNLFGQYNMLLMNQLLNIAVLSRTVIAIIKV